MAANQSTRLRVVVSPDSLSDPIARQTLEAAAALFVKNEGAGVTKIWAASQDWFMEEWGRDTFISLPGLMLTTKRYGEAQQIFRHFASFERNGIIPNIIHDDEQSYNTVDASLWFIHALRTYGNETDDWAFVAEMLPTVRNILKGYMAGTAYSRGGMQYQIRMGEDGLILSPPQATWMDADPSGDGSHPVTPRNGKCVEINALWYGALRFAVAAEKKQDATADTHELEDVAELVKETYATTFWNADRNCLYDVVGGDENGAAIRPNQIFAISHGDDLLSEAQQAQVLDVVTDQLLTAGGLRTLAPSDSMYRGHYDTSAPMSEKDLAYHQGTVWPWLIGPYCDALRIVWKAQGRPDEEITNKVRGIIAPLVQFCVDSDYKSLPEVFSGDEPHEPGGTRSQAWSVAEVLRIFESVE